MSQTTSDPTHTTTDTTADIHAAQSSVTDAEVAASMATPAPASTFETDLAALTARVAAIEPVVNTLASIAGAVDPAVAPVTSRVAAVEGFVNDLLASLNAHFSGKIPLPSPPPVGGSPVGGSMGTAVNPG